MDQRVWSVGQCRQAFAECVNSLKARLLEHNEDLVWDKVSHFGLDRPFAACISVALQDDDTCMNFVTACANLRARCFHIQQKSRFDVKCKRFSDIMGLMGNQEGLSIFSDGRQHHSCHCNHKRHCRWLDRGRSCQNLDRPDERM